MVFYIIRKVLGAIPVVFGVIALVFVLTTIIPGNPAQLLMGHRGDPETLELIKQDLGLDRPLGKQLVEFFKNILTFDLGKSYRNNMPVTTAIAERIPVTALLALLSIIVTVTLGMVLGIVSAVKHNSWIDYLCMFIAVIGISIPGFWFGIMLIVVFCVELGWIPGTGTGEGGIIYYILPAITLGFRPMALIARLTRSEMIEVLNQDYIMAARAKGLPEHIVILKHAMRNTLIPVVTVVGMQTAYFLSGAVIIEQLFSLPGLGRLMLEAILNRDFPIIRGVILFMALVFVGVNLLIDLIYPLLDPRINY